MARTVVTWLASWFWAPFDLAALFSVLHLYLGLSHCLSARGLSYPLCIRECHGLLLWRLFGARDCRAPGRGLGHATIWTLTVCSSGMNQNKATPVSSVEGTVMMSSKVLPGPIPVLSLGLGSRGMTREE